MGGCGKVEEYDERERSFVELIESFSY